MFVGYEVKSNFSSAKPVVLETDIKLSQAVLDPAGKVNKKEPVCVMVEHNKKQFILAVLDPGQSWQCPLDLMFAAGSEVKFFLRGPGTVHLTGFEYREEMDDIDISMSSDDEDEVSEDEGLFALNERQSKIKALENGVKSKKKKDTGVKPGAKGDQPDSDEDEDDEDDEDFDELAGDEDDSDLDAFGEESSEDEDEEMEDNDTLGQLDVEGDSDDDDEDDDEDEESDSSSDR